MRKTRHVLVVLAVLLLFTGVAAAQGDGGGSFDGLIQLIQTLVDFLNALLEALRNVGGS